MFPRRYYCAPMFAPRFFPPTGEAPAPVVPPTIRRVVVLNRTRRSEVTLNRTRRSNVTLGGG